MNRDAKTLNRFRQQAGWSAVALLVGGLVIGSLGGCTDPTGPPPAEPEPSTVQTRQALMDQARVVLDETRQGGEEVLSGTVEGVRPNTDAPRVVVLDEVPDALGSLQGARVLDARLVPGGAVVLGVDGVLSHHTASETRELDTEVLGPLSTVGSRIAYIHGSPPDLGLAVMDLDWEEPRRLAPELSTVWSPALSADGDEVIFVASSGGRPQLFRADLAGGVVALPVVAITPSSPRAPIWRDGELFFEHEGGVVRFDVSAGTIQEELVGAKLRPDDGSGAVRVLVAGEERVLKTGGVR